jgi:hypothetical protein
MKKRNLSKKMVQPSTDKIKSTVHLPSPTPESDSSTGFGLMTETTQTKLNSTKEPFENISKQIEENEPVFGDVNNEKMNDFFLEPIAQIYEPEKMSVIKEEKIEIVTDETDAIFKNH